MATVIEVGNFRQGYIDVCREVVAMGDEVAPRGQKTRELLDVMIVLADPTDSLPIGTGRQVNPSVGAIEALQLVGATETPELTVQLIPQMGAYREPNGYFWGAYGRRIGAQACQVEQKLRDDPSSRQAVITLWQPWSDNSAGKRDYPCTVMQQFLIRHDRLLMHTTMRSNDVWLGLAADVFQFTQLQLALAASLGLEPGPYHHHAVSLHAYERDWEPITELRLSATAQGTRRYPAIGLPGQSMQERVARARDLLFASVVWDATGHEAWLRSVTSEKKLTNG